MKVVIIGLDLAKHIFQVHGADAEGHALLRKRLRRSQVARFFANLPPCVVGMEACCGAHYWSRVDLPPKFAGVIIRRLPV